MQVNSCLDVHVDTYRYPCLKGQVYKNLRHSCEFYAINNTLFQPHLRQSLQLQAEDRRRR